MAADPITSIKEDIARLQQTCEELRTAINSSMQKDAADKLQLLDRGLDRVKARLHNEFGWLMPKLEE